MQLPLAAVHAWTDGCSTIVLGWPSGNPHVQVQDVCRKPCVCVGWLFRVDTSG